MIWAIAVRHVEPLRGKATRARGDLAAIVITRIGLRLESEEPPPLHANIVGWPDTKDARMSLAQQLAAESRLVLRGQHL